MAFYTGTSWESNFVISFSKHPRSDFGVFAKGYLHAASNLSEDLLSRLHFGDYDAYPIVFLYRLSLELYLKNVIYRSALLSAFKGLNDIDSNLYNNHNLVLLSEKAAGLLRKLFPGDEELEQIVDRIVTVSLQFSDIDPNSQGYRYPINKQGMPSTKPHQEINLRVFHQAMKELLEQLETISFGLDVETDRAQDVWEILGELRVTMGSGSQV